MLILVTNDDGVRSLGIRALATAMRDVGDVVVVAPDRNRSAVGHSVTLDHPVRAEEFKPGVFAVDGTPTDCVNLAVRCLLDRRPDLVVSGINRGSNLGDDVTYSGTVCAALEASLLGIPSFAVSLDSTEFNRDDLDNAAGYSASLARRVVASGLSHNTFLNVNVPSGLCSGVALTHQGKRCYGADVVRNRDPQGRNYYWLASSDIGFEDIPGSDCNAVAQGLISVTPLRTIMTDDASREQIYTWLPGHAGEDL